MIEFPGWLEWLGAVVGMEWPDGNEDDMWALAGDWHAAADELRVVLTLMDEAKTATLAAYPAGEGRRQMSDTFDSMRTGKDSLEALAGYFDQVGDSVDGGGTQIQYTKLMFYSTLVITAADIAAVWIFPPTAPAAEAGIIVATRVAVRVMLRRMLTAMAGWAGRLAENALVRFVFRHVLLNAGLGALQEFAIQEFQVWQGHRDGLDWNQLGLTTFAAGVGGAAGGGFGEALGRKFGNAFRDEAGDITSKWGANLTRAGIGAGSGLVNSAAAFGGMVGWQFTSDLAHGGLGTAVDNLKNTHVDWRMFSAGGITGGVSAVNHNFAHSHFENSPFWKLNAPRVDLGNIGELHNFRHDGTVPNAHVDPQGADPAAVHGVPVVHTGAGSPDAVRGGAGPNDHGVGGGPATTAGVHERPSGAGLPPESVATSHDSIGDRSDSPSSAPSAEVQGSPAEVRSSGANADGGPVASDSPSRTMPQQEASGAGPGPHLTSETAVGSPPHSEADAVPEAHDRGTGTTEYGPAESGEAPAAQGAEVREPSAHTGTSDSTPPPSDMSVGHEPGPASDATSSPAPAAASTAVHGPGASPGTAASTGPGTSSGTSTTATGTGSGSPADARGPAAGSEVSRTGDARPSDAARGAGTRTGSEPGRGAVSEARPQPRAGAADPSGPRPAAEPRVQARVAGGESPQRPTVGTRDRLTAETEPAPARDYTGAGAGTDQVRAAEPPRTAGEPHEGARAPQAPDQAGGTPDRPAAGRVSELEPARNAREAEHPDRSDAVRPGHEPRSVDRSAPRDPEAVARRDVEQRADPAVDSPHPSEQDVHAPRDPDSGAPRDSEHAGIRDGEHPGRRDLERDMRRATEGRSPDLPHPRDVDSGTARDANEPVTRRVETGNDNIVPEHDVVPHESSAGEHASRVGRSHDDPAARSHDDSAAGPHDDPAARSHDDAAGRSHDEAVAGPHDDSAARPHDDAASAPLEPRTDSTGHHPDSGSGSEAPRRRPAADDGNDGAMVKPHAPDSGESHRRDNGAGNRLADQAVPGMPAHPADVEHGRARPVRTEQPEPERPRPAEPAGPAVRDESTRGRCAELALRLIRELTGSRTIRLPERAIGPEGMTAAEVQADAGGRMVRVADHDVIARRLSRMRAGAAALVVDGYHAGPGRRVVGAHAYVMTHEGGGRIVVRDQSTGLVTEHPADTPPDLHDTQMILFDRKGRPVHPLTPEQREALTRQQDPVAVRIRQAFDDHTGRVRELLLRTPTGRRILEGLTDSRYRDHIDRGASADGRYGSFRRGDITAVVYADGRGQIAQALTLAHESVHAERYLDGASPADRPLELSRDEYVREMVHEEAVASGRRFRLAAELRELGYDIVERDPEAAYRRAYETALRGTDGPGAHEIAHEVAVDHLRNYLEHVSSNDSGRTYADHYRDIWNRAHELARTPSDHSIRYVPDDPAVRERIRSTALDRHIAEVRLREYTRELEQLADRVADRIPYDPTMRRDMVQYLLAEQLRGVGHELEHGRPVPERAAELRRLGHDLRRMSDVVDQQHNARAEADRLRSDGTAEAGRQLLADMIVDAPGAELVGDHIALIPGEPEQLLVAAGPGDQHRILAEAPPEIAESMARGARTEYLSIRTRDNGEIRYERVDRPDAAHEEPAQRVDPRNLAAEESAAIIAGLQRHLQRTPVGSWAVDTLRARGVTVEHEAGGGHRYEPGRQRLVLDIGGTDAEQLAALVHGAIHAERAHERATADGISDRDRMTRDEYVDQMVDEETAAYAMEFNALAQLRDAGHDIPVSALERIYRDAFTDARAQASRHQGDPPARAAELDRIANQAGIDAIRPAVADHAPDGGPSYRHGYGETWDSAHPPRDDTTGTKPARPPAAPPEPDGSAFVRTYGGDTAYGIKGWVDGNGVLHYEIRVGPDTPTGREMFRDLMHELGDRVQGIHDEWYDGGALTDNLDSFNAGVQDGFTSQESARRTFTGKLARELGYTEVTFGDPDLPGDRGLEGPLGENTGVTVVFRHPDAGSGGDEFTGGAIRPRDVYFQESWARASYERFRADDSDIAEIAGHLAGVPRAGGRVGFTPDEIARLKQHLMRDEHLLRDYENGGHVRRRFDESADIAEAWIRLRSGRPLAEDIVLLEHELREAHYLGEHPDATYAEAHDHANERFNWQDNIPERTGERYDTLWRTDDGNTGVLRPDQGGPDRGGVPVRDDGGTPRSPADHRQADQAVPRSGRPDPGDHGSGRGEDLRAVPDRGNLAGAGHDPGVAHRPEQSGGRNSAEPPRRGAVLVDLGGQRLRLHLVADENGHWRVDSVEPTPSAQPGPGTDVEPAPRGRLRSLWERFTGGYTGHSPKYPSGSGQDGKYQTEMTEDFGHLFDIQALETLGAQGISVNYMRLMKEAATLWLAREHAPLLNHLTARMELQAGEHIPMRNRDGREYAYWTQDADPADVAAMHTYLREVGLGHLVDESQPQDSTGYQPRVESDAPQDNPADELRAAADRLGLELNDISPETLRRARDTAEYQNLRRAAVIEALREAAHRFNAEHADIPYQPQSITDHNPLGRFLKEVIVSRGGDPGLLNWRGVNNGAESGRDFDVLDVDHPDQRIEYDPDQESGRDQGLRGYFENALRRDQIRDERATWADLLAADLSRLEPEQLDRALNELRDGVHERTGQIREFADQVAEFRKHFPAGDIRELPPERPGEPARLVILDARGDHEQVLAGALDRYSGLAARLNEGALRAEKWTVVVDTNNVVHVRHLGDIEAHGLALEVDGRQLTGLLIHAPDGTWHMTHAPAEPVPVAPHARTPEQIRAVRDELARELGLDPELITPELLEHELRANELRALQIEALADHARSTDAIESFHDLTNARDRLAQTVGVDEARRVTAEHIGERIADRGTRNALRKQQVEMLVKYYDKLSSYLKNQGGDRAPLVAARDDLVRALGGDPAEVHPKKYTEELRYLPDEHGIDPGTLAGLIRRRAGEPGAAAAIADFVRALGDTDPFTDGLRFDPATDPRVFDGEVPMHDAEALDQVRRVAGDGRRIFDDTEPDGRPLGSQPSRDWARLLGHDLTAATPEQYVRAYEAYRDGKIEKHERLNPAQRDDVHRELREEVRRRAADLHALAELNERHRQAVADLPEHRRARIERLSREWAAAWTDRERAREFLVDHAHELRVAPEELLADDLKDGAALGDLFDELGARTIRGDNPADFARRLREFTARHEALFDAARRFHDNDARIADLDTELRAAVERDVALSRDEGDDGEGTSAAPPQGPPRRPPESGSSAEPPHPEDRSGGGSRQFAGEDMAGVAPRPETPLTPRSEAPQTPRPTEPTVREYVASAGPHAAEPRTRAETPSEWGLRMRAENASWSARMAARHALRMRELADEAVARDPDGADGAMSWDARMAADRAEWEARTAAQRADWLWNLVGDDRPGPGADPAGDDGSGGSPAKPGGDRPGGAAPKAAGEPATDSTDGGAPARRDDGVDGSEPRPTGHDADNSATPPESAPPKQPPDSAAPDRVDQGPPERESWHQVGPQREHRPVTRALRHALRDLADAGADRVRAWTRMTARAEELGLRPDRMRRELLRESIARLADGDDVAPAVRDELRDLITDLDNDRSRWELDRRAERLGVPRPSDHQLADAIRDRLAPPAQRRAELSIELGERRTVGPRRLAQLAREFGVDPHGLTRADLQHAVREAVNSRSETIPERQRRAAVQLVDRYRVAAANESARRAAAQHAAERELMQVRAGFDDRGPRISGVSYRRIRLDVPGRLRAEGAGDARGRWVGVGVHGDPEVRMPARERERQAAAGFDAVYFGVELDRHGRVWVSEHHPDHTEPPATQSEPRRPGDWRSGAEHEYRPSSRVVRRQLRELGAELGRRNDQVDANFAKIVRIAEHLGIDQAWRLRPDELSAAVRELITQHRARADALWNRAEIPRTGLKDFFEARRSEEAAAEEAESLGTALLGLLRVHEQTLVVPRDRIAADAAVLAARDVQAGQGGRALDAEGRAVDPERAVARMVPGREGGPDRLVVVAPGADPDRILEPAVRRALLGSDGEFIFRQVRVDVDGRVRILDMHGQPTESDHIVVPRPELEGSGVSQPDTVVTPARDPQMPVGDPQAALDARVRERAQVAADLEFWRTKVDHRAEPFGDPDLSRSHWSQTLRQLRGDNTRYVRDSTGMDAPDLSRRERLLPGQEREQTELVDKLAAALERYFQLEDRLDTIDREVHALEQQGARHDASLAEEVRDELGRIADGHRAAVQRAKPLWRTVGELSRMLNDPAQRTPEQLRRLADAQDAARRAEHRIDRFNDERVALVGAWPDAVTEHVRAEAGEAAPVLHRLSENVWVDRGGPGADGAPARPARIIVVAGRSGFDQPDVPVHPEHPDGLRRPGDDRFDAPLLDAFALHHELAELLRDPDVVIDRLMVTGELAAGAHDGAGTIVPRAQALAPVRLERMELPPHRGGRLPFAGDTMVRWHGADGRLHDPREGQARGLRAYQPELPSGTALDKHWQREVDGWRLPPKGWAAFGGTDNSHIPYRQREEKMPDGFSGTMGAEPFQNMVEPLVLRLLTDHWPELSYEQILTLSEAGRAELWWHQGPGPKPEPPPGWDEHAHEAMPLDGALYTIGKRWVQLYDMARKHPWVLGPLQRRPEIGEWVRAHTTRLPDGPFDPDHPVLRKIPIVRSFRGWKGWSPGPRTDLQPPHRPWSATDHVPPRERVEWSTPRQDREIARWAAVQRWADRVIGRFADDAGDTDVSRIVEQLNAARDPLLDPSAPGGTRAEALNLARHPDGTVLTREQLIERLRSVKNHLMRNEMWVRDHADPTGRLIHKPYDRLPHVADAWLRLTGVGDGDGRRTPHHEDLLLLDDAYAEAKYLADHHDATWYDADLEAARHGYDWDSNRRRLSGHLVIRDGHPIHPDELPPGDPERDGDRTLRMSRLIYAVDAPVLDTSWLPPRARRAAEILAETGVRQRFPGLAADPVDALKQLAARDTVLRRALTVPWARDPLLESAVRAGRVELLADATGAEERVGWARRLGEPDAAVRSEELPETIARLRDEITDQLRDRQARTERPASAPHRIGPRPGGENMLSFPARPSHGSDPDEGASGEPEPSEHPSESGASGAAKQPPDGGDPDRGAGAAPGARPPRKTYITPVPHVPHDPEFDWPDYEPKPIDIPPTPIPPVPPQRPTENPPHQPHPSLQPRPERPGGAEPGGGADDGPCAPGEEIGAENDSCGGTDPGGGDGRGVGPGCPVAGLPEAPGTGAGGQSSVPVPPWLSGSDPGWPRANEACVPPQVPVPGAGGVPDGSGRPGPGQFPEEGHTFVPGTPAAPVPPAVSNVPPERGSNPTPQLGPPLNGVPPLVPPMSNVPPERGANPVPQQAVPLNGFPPFAPPVPNGGRRSASTGTSRPVRPNRSATAPPPILVQEFGGTRCAEIDPLTGALSEIPALTRPPSGVFGELDGAEIVFFRSGAQLFVRIDGQLIGADDLAIVTHWHRVRRRSAEFAVTRAGIEVCRVRYRRPAPEHDLGLWVSDILDNPARRARIFIGSGVTP